MKKNRRVKHYPGPYWRTVLSCILVFAWLATPAPAAGQQAGRAVNEPDSALRQRFLDYDRDGDGVIVHDELLQARRLAFSKIDGDRNKLLREGEFMAYQARIRQNRISQRQFGLIQRGFYRLDRNHDKTLTLEEFLRAANRQLDVLDANRDGKIPWEEFSRKSSLARQRGRRR